MNNERLEGIFADHKIMSISLSIGVMSARCQQNLDLLMPMCANFYNQSLAPSENKKVNKLEELKITSLQYVMH